MRLFLHHIGVQYCAGAFTSVRVDVFYVGVPIWWTYQRTKLEDTARGITHVQKQEEEQVQGAPLPGGERLVHCSSSGFPCVGVRLIYWSLRSTATFVMFFHWSLLLAISLNVSSSSAFLRSLFTLQYPEMNENISSCKYSGEITC